MSPTVMPAAAAPTPETCAAVLEQHAAEWRAAVAAEDRLISRTSWLTRVPHCHALAVTDPGPLAVPEGFARVGPLGTPLLAATADQRSLCWMTPEAHLQALAEHVERLYAQVSTSYPPSTFLPELGCAMGAAGLFSGGTLGLLTLTCLPGEPLDWFGWATLGIAVGLGGTGLVATVWSVCALRRTSAAAQAGAVLQRRQARLDALRLAARRREATAVACAQATAALPLPASDIP